jgi:hypothetical protein
MLRLSFMKNLLIYCFVEKLNCTGTDPDLVKVFWIRLWYLCSDLIA